MEEITIFNIIFPASNTLLTVDATMIIGVLFTVMVFQVLKIPQIQITKMMLGMIIACIVPFSFSACLILSIFVIPNYMLNLYVVATVVSIIGFMYFPIFLVSMVLQIKGQIKKKSASFHLS